MNKLITIFLISSSWLVCNPNPAVAQNSSRFDITLDASWESKLKTLGTLQSTIRADSRGKISAIQIEYAETQNKPHVENTLPFTIAGDACQLTLTDELLAIARNRPLRIPVPDGSPFVQVFLNYDSGQTRKAVARSSGGAPVRNASNRTVIKSAPMHYVKLSGRKMIMGQMDLTQKLKFTTKFGEVDIALGQIAGIRFHIDGEDSAQIVLKNGDSVTGIPAMQSINLTTDWGRAEFEPTYVEEITTNQRASFSQSKDPQFGQRWTLNNR